MPAKVEISIKVNPKDLATAVTDMSYHDMAKFLRMLAEECDGKRSGLKFKHRIAVALVKALTENEESIKG